MRFQIVEQVDYARTVERNDYVPVMPVPDLRKLEVLTEKNRHEVYEFLNVRPVHTVVIKSYLKDNGFESEHNRGKYYGYRDHRGNLTGVALIGHSTLVETSSDEALMAFALIARESETPINLMMSEGRAIERFWEFYKENGAQPRHLFTEKLFEINFPFPVQNCDWEVRTATAEEIDQIAEAHAEVAFIETGENPMDKDPEGFVKRCLRRIEQDRTFVVFENGKLLFKADIVAETENVIYLEGIYVSTEMRGKRIGPKCLSKLSTMLLERVQNICMLSNLKFEWAHRSFERAGYATTDSCTTIFV